MNMLTRLLLVTAMTGLAAYPQVADSDGPAKFYEDLIRSPIVPDRPVEQVKEDLRRAEEDKKRADTVINDAQARERQAADWVKQHKDELKAAADRAKAAKKEKRESDLILLEAEHKQLSLVEDYLKTMATLRKTEVNQGRAMKSVAEAERQAFSSELELREKIAAWTKSGPDSPGYVEAAIQATQTAEKTLNLMEKMASAHTDLANREKRLAAARVKLVVARNKLLTEDRIRAASQAMSGAR